MERSEISTRTLSSLPSPGNFFCKYFNDHLYGNNICLDFDYKIGTRYLYHNKYTENIDIFMKIYLK